MPRLHQERHRGFTVRHFHERLARRHDGKLGFTTTPLWLQGAVAPAPRRGAHRRKRPRRAMVGMPPHRDAATHAWPPGRHRSTW